MAYSKIGFHFSTGGNKTGTGSWITTANQKGIPVGLKGVSDYGLIYEAIQKGNQHGVNNWLVYRMSKAAGTISRETPNYTANPQTDAIALCNEALSKLPPEFDKSKVWLELLNEPRGKWTGEPVWNNLHPVDYLGVWCHAAALYLNEKGYGFCGPSFNSGEPGDDGKGLADAVNQYSQPGMLNYLQYCAENPDMAALAVHEYVWAEPRPWYPHLWGRFEAAIAAADKAGIPRTFHIFVTEFGYEYTNAPKYPAVTPDLDYYNQIAAKFPQLKFAASWTLQSGYDPVDGQIITWVNYPIEKEFDEGPQPAVTHTVFGGTLPGGSNPMPANLLKNPSYEKGTYKYKRPDGTLIDEINVPEDYTLWFAPESKPNPYDSNPWAVWRPPEVQTKDPGNLPAGEVPIFIKDGVKCLKAFKGTGSTWFALGQVVPAGKYRLTFGIFPDIVVGYENGQKVFATDPNSCIVWVYAPGKGKTAEQRPVIGEFNYLTFDFEMVQSGRFDVHVQLPFPVDDNGVFLDNNNLIDLDAVPDPPLPPPPPSDPPPPDETFKQRLWEASLVEQNTNGVTFNPALGLWQIIKADGLDVMTHERMFEGVAYQVAARPDGERWVYTWTATDGFGRFKWPEETPPTSPVINYVVDQLAKHATLTYLSRPLSAITALTIHHSVSGGGSNPFAEVKSIAQYHVSPRPPDVPDGWPGIGYHFCIGANGAIYQVNKLTTKSYHAGSWNAPGDENYWSAGICLLGNFTTNPPPQVQLDAARSLVAYLKGLLPTVTDVTRHKDMPGAATQCPGNTSPQWFDYVAGGQVPPPVPTGIAMTPYFLPASGDYGDIVILKNNWGQGDERQQLQKVGNFSYVTKNNQWEKRELLSDGIYLRMDTSPNEQEYYTVTGSPWLPLSWKVGDEFLRTNTVKFFNKADCVEKANYTTNDKLRFNALLPSWTSPGGIQLSNVIELQWVLNNTVEETYHYAPGLGLVEWQNKAGLHSWITERIPVGQQANNVRGSGCYGS